MNRDPPVLLFYIYMIPDSERPGSCDNLGLIVLNWPPGFPGNLRFPGSLADLRFEIDEVAS